MLTELVGHVLRSQFWCSVADASVDRMGLETWEPRARCVMVVQGLF